MDREFHTDKRYIPWFWHFKELVGLSMSRCHLVIQRTSSLAWSFFIHYEDPRLCQDRVARCCKILSSSHSTWALAKVAATKTPSGVIGTLWCSDRKVSHMKVLAPRGSSLCWMIPETFHGNMVACDGKRLVALFVLLVERRPRNKWDVNDLQPQPPSSETTGVRHDHGQTGSSLRLRRLQPVQLVMVVLLQIHPVNPRLVNHC